MPKQTEVIQMVGSGLIKTGVYLSNKCATIFLSRMCEIRKDEKNTEMVTTHGVLQLKTKDDSLYL